LLFLRKSFHSFSHRILCPKSSIGCRLGFAIQIKNDNFESDDSMNTHLYLANQNVLLALTAMLNFFISAQRWTLCKYHLMNVPAKFGSNVMGKVLLEKKIGKRLQPMTTDYTRGWTSDENKESRLLHILLVVTVKPVSNKHLSDQLLSSEYAVVHIRQVHFKKISDIRTASDICFTQDKF